MPYSTEFILDAFSLSFGGNEVGAAWPGKPTGSKRWEDTFEMSAESSPKITQVERLKGGVLISFGNGKEGFYSDESLYASLPDAQQRLEQALERDRALRTAD